MDLRTWLLTRRWVRDIARGWAMGKAEQNAKMDRLGRRGPFPWPWRKFDA